MKGLYVIAVFFWGILGVLDTTHAQTLTESTISTQNANTPYAVLARKWLVDAVELKDLNNKVEEESIRNQFNQEKGKFYFSFDPKGTFDFFLVNTRARGDWKLVENDKVIYCQMHEPEATQVLNIVDITPHKLTLSFKVPSGNGSAVLTLLPASAGN